MLILALILSLTLVVISIRRYKKIFNPFTLEVYFTVLFLIVPQLIMLRTEPRAQEYFYSDLVIMVYVLSIFCGTLINFKSFKLKGIENVTVIQYLNVVLYALLVMPLLPYLLRFGLSAEGFRQFYETVVFSKYASFYELSKLVLYFIIFFKLIKREKFSLGFFILFPLVFFYGSRFVILDCIIYVCVFLEQYKEVSIKKIVALCLSGAFVIGLYTYYQFSLENFYFLFVSYFDIYKNQSLVINNLIRGDMDYYYGQIHLSSYLKYIPRFLWEDKPKAFGFAILNYRFFPREAANGYMPSFGLGVLFADFGFFSVFLTGFIAGVIRNYLYRLFLNSRNNLSFFLLIFSFTMVTNLFLILYLVLDRLISGVRSFSAKEQYKTL